MPQERRAKGDEILRDLPATVKTENFSSQFKG